MTLATEDADRTIQNKEFISMVSRCGGRGLQHPSDCVFVTCAHAYQFYEKVKNDKALDFLLMDNSKPREIFVNTLSQNAIKVTLSVHLFRKLYVDYSMLWQRT